MISIVLKDEKLNSRALSERLKYIADKLDKGYTNDHHQRWTIKLEQTASDGVIDVCPWGYEDES